MTTHLKTIATLILICIFCYLCYVYPQTLIIILSILYVIVIYAAIYNIIKLSQKNKL
jgi:hypothetical protein